MLDKYIQNLPMTHLLNYHINICLQDGAGRVGKMLFARQGKKFDYDLKQVLTRKT